jgi:hypothetical protein
VFANTRPFVLIDLYCKEVKAYAPHGDVAELADALDLGSSSFTGVQVQLLSSPLSLQGILDVRYPAVRESFIRCGRMGA